MELRGIPLVKGARVWMANTLQANLPHDAPHRQQVEIQEWTTTGRFIVEAEGRTWNVSRWNLISPNEYRTRQGTWLPESDPRVLEALEKLLAQEVKNLESRVAESAEGARSYREYVDSLVWTLERNGRKFNAVVSGLSSD